MTSPGGYQYPRALPWDMSAEDLELALEWTYDVGEVTVSYDQASDGTRTYEVTFDVRNLPVMCMDTHTNTFTSAQLHA